jgi:hypothetical protein
MLRMADHADTLVNEHNPALGPRPVRLTANDFRLLEGAGAFAGYEARRLRDWRWRRMGWFSGGHGKTSGKMLVSPP